MAGEQERLAVRQHQSPNSQRSCCFILDAFQGPGTRRSLFSSTFIPWMDGLFVYKYIHTQLKTRRLPLPAVYPPARPCRMQTRATPRQGAVSLPWGAGHTHLPIARPPSPSTPSSSEGPGPGPDACYKTPHPLNFIIWHHFTKVGTVWRDCCLLLVKFSDQALGDIISELNFLKRRKDEAVRASDLQLSNGSRALKLKIK